MEEPVSFEGIAEVAITLAGFTGLHMMLRTGPLQDWHPRARFPFWSTLIWSLGALVFSYLPSVLMPFGLAEWTVPNLLLAAFLTGAATSALWHHRHLTQRGSPTQAPLHLTLHLSISYLGGLTVLCSAIGLLRPPGVQWYRVGVLASLFAALPPFLASFRIQEERST